MVVDHQHWAGFGLFTGFNDDFFMSLMFFLSGLFVWSSLQRKGNANFVRDRLRRLGIPFLFAAAIIAPIAYYPSYLLTTGPHSVAGYIHDWLIVWRLADGTSVVHLAPARIRSLRRRAVCADAEFR